MKAIGATVTVVVLLIVAIIATVLIFGCVHYCKNRRVDEQFQFRSMTYRDVKEKEAKLDAKEEEPPPGEGKEALVAEEKA